MNLNIVIALIMGILAATGVDTKNVDVDAIKKSVIESQINDTYTQSINNSNENNNDTDNNDNAINDDESSDDSDDENIEDDDISLEEKYLHNQNRDDSTDDDNILYYVPYCNDGEHDFEIIKYADPDGYGIEYLCKKCGYDRGRIIPYGHFQSNQTTYRISCPKCSYCTREKEQ